MQCRRLTTAARVALSLSAACLAACKGVEPLTPEQVARALEIVWNNPGNTLPLCTGIGRQTYLAAQTGVQGLQQRAAPGQWVIRVMPPIGDRDVDQEHWQDIRRLDYLAKFQMLTKSVSRITVGPIAGIPAAEYRLTVKGWAQDIAPAGGTFCLYFGSRQLLGIKNFVELEKDKDGFSKVVINFSTGVKETAEWARGDEASTLFPEIKKQRDGEPGTMTLLRDREGRLVRSRDSKAYLDTAGDKAGNTADKGGNANTAKASAPPSEDEVRAAIEKVPTSPLKQSEQAMPGPCLRLAPRYGPAIWNQSQDETERKAVLLLYDRASGAEAELRTLAHKRLLDLAKAGLVTLKQEARVPGSDSTRGIHAELNVANEGGCLSLGKTRLEIFPARSRYASSATTRFKARYLVTEPAPWIAQIKNPQILPDLAVILQEGLPFEGDATRGPAGVQISNVTDGYPSVRMTSISAVGMSPDWYGQSSAAAGSPLVAADHELHIVSADMSTRPEVTDSRAGGAWPVVNIYLNPTARPAILLLQAYDSVDWRIHRAPGAKLAAAVALGYHPQRIGDMDKTVIVTAYQDRGKLGIDGSGTQYGSFERSGNGLLRMLDVTPASINETTGARPIVIGKEFSPNASRRK